MGQLKELDYSKGNTANVLLNFYDREESIIQRTPIFVLQEILRLVQEAPRFNFQQNLKQPIEQVLRKINIALKDITLNSTININKYAELMIPLGIQMDQLLSTIAIENLKKTNNEIQALQQVGTNDKFINLGKEYQDQIKEVFTQAHVDKAKEILTSYDKHNIITLAIRAIGVASKLKIIPQEQEDEFATLIAECFNTRKNPFQAADILIASSALPSYLSN